MRLWCVRNLKHGLLGVTLKSAALLSFKPSSTLILPEDQDRAGAAHAHAEDGAIGGVDQFDRLPALRREAPFPA